MPTEFPRLRKQFTDELIERLKPYGYKFNKRYCICCYRKTNYGMDIIDVRYIADPGKCFLVEVDFGVRYDAIEDIVLPYTHFNPSVHRWIATIGNRLDNFLRRQKNVVYLNRSCEWLVFTEEDVEPQLQSVVETINNIIFPIFRRFSDHEELYHLLSKDDEEAERYTMFNYTRAYNAVAAAYVFGKSRDEFEELVRRKTEYLDSFPDNNYMNYGRKVFRDVVEHIRCKWQESA